MFLSGTCEVIVDFYEFLKQLGELEMPHSKETKAPVDIAGYFYLFWLQQPNTYRIVHAMNM